MADTYDLSQELRLLSPASLRVYLDSFGDLRARTEGGVERGPLRALRTFPLSHPDRYVVLKEVDGDEIGMVPDISALDRDSRKVLRDALERAYFIPEITAILDVQARFHVPEWTVETNRGRRSFELRSARSDIRTFDDGRILIRDADGNRYLIMDPRALDLRSRALLETQL
jgi:hypothetical protein